MGRIPGEETKANQKQQTERHKKKWRKGGDRKFVSAT
jgi:hypothetical protein